MFAAVALILAAPTADWSAIFAGTAGWIGGDAAYSVPLGPNRVAWLFGDSLIGTVKNGRRDAVMINNAVAIQAGTSAESPVMFFTGTTADKKPHAIFTPPDGRGWLWPFAGVAVGKELLVFMPQVVKAPGGEAFGFRPVAQWLATIPNPGDEPPAWKPTYRAVPFASFEKGRERSFGSATLIDGEFLYVYGYADAGSGIGKRQLLAARVPVRQATDFAAWRFRTADGWSEKPADAAHLAGGLATEFGVCPRPGGGFALVYTRNGIGAEIVARYAESPAGPWGEPKLLYKCPEAADKELFCYSAKPHPWAAVEGGVLVTYCVNAFRFGRLFEDATMYRPRAVVVSLK